MSRTSPSCLQIATVIVVVIEFLFLIYDAIMVGLLIHGKDELELTFLNKIKESDANDGKPMDPEQEQRMKSVVENVIIPIVLAVCVVLFTFSLILTLVLTFGVKQKRPRVLSVWICMMIVFLILNLIYLLPAIILIPDYSTKIDFINLGHQIYRIIAVVIICLYAKEIRRRMVSGQSGDVYAVQYHIPPEQ